MAPTAFPSPLSFTAIKGSKYGKTLLLTRRIELLGMITVDNRQQENSRKFRKERVTLLLI
jgi:hypothetical protein